MFCKYKLKEPKIVDKKLFKISLSMKPFQISLFYSVLESKKTLWEVKIKRRKMRFHAYHKCIIRANGKNNCTDTSKTHLNCQLETNIK